MNTTTTSIIQTLIQSHTNKFHTHKHTLHFTNPNIIQIKHRQNHHILNAIDAGGSDVDTAVVEKDTTEKVKRRCFQVLDGYPTPFGASVRDDGVNFAIFSRNAESASLCLMTPDDLPQKRVTEEISLDQLSNKTGDVWHVFLKGDFTDMLYGYKLSGEFCPEEGHYYDSSQILLDPYAKAVVSRGEFGVLGPDDDCWSQMACRVPSIDEFDWEGDLPLSFAQRDLVIYEMHVRGFTRHESSKTESRGTYLGVVDKLDHLKELGVNCIELMPCHEFNELEYFSYNPVLGDYRLNYWGYSTINYFSPMLRYASAGARNCGLDAINEFKQLVKEAHKRGIELLMDVVFNHTAEGNENGPILSFRGVDNSAFYMLAPKGEFYNYSGCGNTFNCNHPFVRQFIVDSLRYWVTEMHVDGFRFDLASIMTRAEEELHSENEDGISILFYLQKIYPDEWRNFEERMRNPKLNATEKDRTEATRQWVSYRGQTLSRTVRGMMYYKEALELQCFLDSAKDNEIFTGYRTVDMNKDHRALKERAQALTDLKFTYVVSCQIYGAQKKSSDHRDQSCYVNILNLMLKYPSLRVAYIDEREDTINGKPQKVYYSVLVKGGDKLDEEIYRIKLPGPPTYIGEGKPENQNHAIIFTRGEALQTIDMNQDNYFEEAFKMRNVLEEFHKDHHGDRRPTILGLREHIFTGGVSSLAWFMSNQEKSFVTIGQRILADPLRVRFHYGHPDIFDRIFHITRGGISKASKIINLSEDIFSGYNSTLRGGYVTHHEYIQVGKGRDVGMNQISLFEAKVANGNGEQTLSRDVYRLGRRFDFFRMFSFYFTTVGFYFSSLVTVLVVYVFLYGRMYLVLSGLEKKIMENATINSNRALEETLATQSVFQLGLILVLPMAMEVGLESGFRRALGDFIIMQLQLASVFFTFQLGTKVHYYGKTILHGGSKYRATGRGFVVFHAKFADNYRLYSRSHFVKGIELGMLLVIYQVYGNSYRSSNLYLFITFSIWFLVSSWLFAPFVFNPSGFDWQKTVEDWTDWKRWMGNRGGIGIDQDKSWESWWDTEQEHLKNTNIRGRIAEIVLTFRFFIYQYGLVYHLNIASGSRSILVYGLSWLVMITALLGLKMVSMGRRRFGTDFQLTFRILKALLFLGFLSIVMVLFVVCSLTLSDIFAAFLAFTPTGWAFLQIGQACRPCVEAIGFWDSIMELGRAYECVMGLIIFMPIVTLSWFPFVSEFQTRLLFNQAFSRGLQISMILAGKKDKTQYA